MGDNRPVPQQAMGGQPGVQSRPANLPMQPNQQKQVQQIQPRDFQTAFHGFSLRKAPADPGERPSWDRIKPQPFPVSTKEFNSENRSARTPISPYKVYEHLRTDSQREAIDRLINNFRAHETNPNAVWEIAYIKPSRAVIPGTWGRAEETKDIRVIFKRSPLPYGQQANPQVAQFPYGKIIDTTIPEVFPVPVQKSIQPQQPQAQQVQPIQQVQPSQQVQLSQQGVAKNPQQQQQMNQHQPNQQHPGSMAMPPPMGLNCQPPPPPSMPPPFSGNQLPPLPMQGHPPLAAMQGSRPNPGNAAPVTQIFNLAPPEKQKKQSSEKAKSIRRRSQSPHPRNKLRQSMDALEKIKKWQGPNESDSENDNSDSSNDSGSSVAAHRGYRHSAKEYNKHGYHVPPPPMGPYASGALTPRRALSRSPPLPKRKSSLKKMRGENKRIAERELTGSYRRESSGSDSSYDMVERPVTYRRQYDGTPPTSVGSQSTGSSERDSYGYRRGSRHSHRDRSFSRQRTHHDHALPRSRSRSYDRGARHDRSRDRGRSPNTVDRKSSLREHRRPEAYRGLTPPPQKPEPIIVHNHIHTSNNDRDKTFPQQQQQTVMRKSSSPPLSINELSLDDFSYAGKNPAHHVPTQRALPYPTNDHLPILPRAPIVPSRDELRIQAAHEYMRNQQRRDSLADLEMREQLERRKDALLVDKLRRERERERNALPARSLPFRNDFSDASTDYARIRPARGGFGRNDDFTSRHDNDWSRPCVARRNTNAGVRFGNAGGATTEVFDKRDPFQYSRSTAGIF